MSQAGHPCSTRFHLVAKPVVGALIVGFVTGQGTRVVGTCLDARVLLFFSNVSLLFHVNVWLVERMLDKEDIRRVDSRIRWKVPLLLHPVSPVIAKAITAIIGFVVMKY